MTAHFKCHLEIAEAQATMHVSGPLPGAGTALIDAVAELPPSVRILRLSLDGVSSVGPEGLVAIDALRTHWETMRRGPFRLALELSKPQRRASYIVNLRA